MTQRKKLLGAVLAASAVLMGAGAAFADDAMQHACPQPAAEHAWLQQLVGEWKTSTEAKAPNQPVVKTVGSEVVRPLGGFWVMDEVKDTMMNKPFTGVMTLGYDAKKGKYIGTWVDSMTGKLWEYEGKVDPAANTLTLEAEGECPMQPGKMMKFRDTLTLKDKDHKVFSSAIQGDDGEWMTMMTSTATRVK